jgi:hypothetical protein
MLGAMPKAGLAAALLGACLAAAAYAAAGRGGHGTRGEGASAAIAAPRILRHPARVSLSRGARFAFEARRTAGFECRLDGAPWRRCASPRRWRHLAPGSHRFAVRGLDGRDRHGRAAKFAWQIVEPKPFSIEQFAQPAVLFPGAPPAQVPVAVGNPNPAPILITALRVAVLASPVGCDAGVNLELLPAGVSSGAPLRLAPGETVKLPARGIEAPAISLRDLPVNQDACQGGRFTLAFAGRAHG